MLGSPSIENVGKKAELSPRWTPTDLFPLVVLGASLALTLFDPEPGPVRSYMVRTLFALGLAMVASKLTGSIAVTMLGWERTALSMSGGVVVFAAVFFTWPWQPAR